MLRQGRAVAPASISERFRSPPRTWLGVQRFGSVVAAQHGTATTQTPREAALAGERSKPARLAVRDHHRRSLCGNSSAQSEQWYCWIGRRRIISASAENRG
jgi:hypothetical protein